MSKTHAIARCNSQPNKFSENQFHLKQSTKQTCAQRAIKNLLQSKTFVTRKLIKVIPNACLETKTDQGIMKPVKLFLHFHQ